MEKILLICTGGVKVIKVREGVGTSLVVRERKGRGAEGGDAKTSAGNRQGVAVIYIGGVKVIKLRKGVGTRLDRQGKEPRSRGRRCSDVEMLTSASVQSL